MICRMISVQVALAETGHATHHQNVPAGEVHPLELVLKVLAFAVSSNCHVVTALPTTTPTLSKALSRQVYPHHAYTPSAKSTQTFAG